MVAPPSKGSPSGKDERLHPPDRLAALPLPEVLARAERYFQTEMWQESLSCLREAAHRGEDFPALRNATGICLYRLGQHREAQKALLSAIDQDPDGFRAQFYLGLTLQALGVHQEATDRLKQVTIRRPDHVEAFFFLGASLRALSRIPEAIAAYRQAIVLQPDFAAAWHNLALCRLATGNLDAAHTAFRQTIALTPTQADGYTGLGDLNFLQQAYGEAVEQYALALERDPQAIAARYGLGLAQHHDGDYAHGVRSLAKAVAAGCAATPPWGAARVRIETSSACNLRCRHCPTGVSYGTVERRTMSMDLFLTVVEQLSQVPNLAECVLYLGGEPLLNRHLEEMIRTLRAGTGVKRIFFNTNGMLLTEERCLKLADCGVDTIEISIDGRSAEENNAIRVGADYRQVAHNIRLLHRLAPKIQLAIANTIVKRPGDPGKAVPPTFLREEFADLPIETHYAMEWPGLDRTRSAMAQGTEELMPPQRFCDKPFTEMAIRANGDVVPCCYDLASENVMGNIEETPLSTIWHNHAYQRLRDLIVNNNEKRLPALCRKCIVYTGATPVCAGSSAG